MRTRWGVTMLLIAVTAVLLCACGSRNERIKTAELLLEEKYGEDFTVTSYEGQEMMADYYSVSAYAKSHPKLPFEANVSEDGTSVSDDYVSRRVCEAISDQVAANITVLPCKYYVHTGIMSGESVCSDPNISIEEFATKWEPNNRYYVYLYISKEIEHVDSSSEIIYNALKEALKGIPEISGTMSVYISNDSVIEKVHVYVTTNTGLYNDYFEIAQDDYRGQFEFDDGFIIFTQQDAETVLAR